MDASKVYAKKHRGVQWFSKRRWVSRGLIVAFIVLVMTWISPNPSRSSFPSDPPNLLFSPQDIESQPEEDRCNGRRVHMYNMPGNFNTDLLKLCDGGLVEWIRFCKHYKNYGFGEPVNTTGYQLDWYRTDAYMLEVIFFDRMRSYPCLTDSPENADIFFLPYFSGLEALPYLYNDTMKSLEQGHGAISWLQQNAANSWLRFGGGDHFMIAGRTGWDFGSAGKAVASDWGTHLFDFAEIQNVTFMVLERRPWRHQEQAIPYPVGFHPSSAQSLNLWIDRVRASDRTALFSFSGALRPQIATNIRGILSNQCANASTDCERLDCAKISCSHNPEPIYESLLRANFCLQPRGDTATRRSTIDSIVSGCIPVLFHEDSAKIQYLWHLPDDYSSFSVFIPEACIMNESCNVQEILRKIPPSQVLRMREKLISMIPSVIYKHPGALDILQSDAFDLTIEGMARKVALLKESTVTKSTGQDLTSS